MQKVGMMQCQPAQFLLHEELLHEELRFQPLARQSAGILGQRLQAGGVGDAIHLTNEASRGASGWVIPLNRQLRSGLEWLFEMQVYCGPAHVVTAVQSDHTSPQMVVDLLPGWSREPSVTGCLPHSKRHTLIIDAARKISAAGASLRDVRLWAGHHLDVAIFCDSAEFRPTRYFEGEFLRNYFNFLH